MPLFTSQTAKAAASLSTQARANRAQAARSHRSLVLSLADSATDYADSRLIRVRDLLNQLDGQLSAELLRAVPDSKRLKELADAAHRLQEQERTLCGRPLPGTTRRDGPAAPLPRAKLPDPR